MNVSSDRLRRICRQITVASPSAEAMNLGNWSGSKFGRYLLQSEQPLLDKTCSALGGYHLMHLGVTAEQCCFQAAKQLHQFYIRPPGQVLGFDAGTTLADYSDLPLPSAVVDVAVLQHALEYSSSPQAVLAETARVMSAGAHLLIFVINPYGPMGLARVPMRLLTQRPEYQFYGLQKNRIKDWLALLNFQVIQVANGAYHMPFERLNNFEGDSLWARGCKKIHFPWGNFYMIHAVKRVAGGIRKTNPLWKPAVSNDYRMPSEDRRMKNQ